MVEEIVNACRHRSCISHRSRTLLAPIHYTVRPIVHLLFGRHRCDQGILVFYTSSRVPELIIQVKHDIKAKLTQSSTGAGGGEGARNYIQVFANSLVASVLILLHTWQIFKQGVYLDDKLCFQRGADVLVIGIVAYADIFAAQSEC
jgi:hypothetical protein